MDPTSPAKKQYNLNSLDVEKAMPETDLILWLQLVTMLSESFSTEDQINLDELSKNIPKYSVNLPIMQDVLDRIKDVVINKKWDPTLAIVSNQIIHNLTNQIHDSKKRL